jgi:hypothetical protein
MGKNISKKNEERLLDYLKAQGVKVEKFINTPIGPKPSKQKSN